MDGEYRWLLIRNMPLRDEQGNIVNLVWNRIDIEDATEPKMPPTGVKLSIRRETQRLSHTGRFGSVPLTGLIMPWKRTAETPGVVNPLCLDR